MEARMSEPASVPMPDPADDPRLTAYALGELDSAEAAEIDRLLASDPAAAAVVDDLRGLAGLLERSLQAESEPGLTLDQRLAIEDAVRDRRLRFVRYRRVAATLAAGLLLALGGFGAGRMLESGKLAPDALARAAGAAPRPEMAVLADSAGESREADFGEEMTPESEMDRLPEAPASAMLSPIAPAAPAPAPEPAVDAPSSRPAEAEPAVSLGVEAKAKEAPEALRDGGRGAAPAAPMRGMDMAADSNQPAAPPAPAGEERPPVARSSAGNGGQPTPGRAQDSTEAVADGMAQARQRINKAQKPGAGSVLAMAQPEVGAVLAKKLENSYALSQADAQASPVDDLYAARVEQGRDVTIQDVQTGAVVGKFANEGEVRSIALSPDNRFVAATSANRVVNIWDVRKNRLVQSLEVREGAAPEVEFVAGNKLVLANAIDLGPAENPFVSPIDRPVWSFLPSASTESVAAIRLALNEGRMPEPGTVRIEELVDAFGYAGPAEAGEGPLSLGVEVASAPWAPAHRLAWVAVKARPKPEADPALVVARDVVVEAEFNPDQVAAYRLIGYDVPSTPAEAGPDALVEVRAGDFFSAFYEIVPAAALQEPVQLRYQRFSTRQIDAAASRELMAVSVRYTTADAEAPAPGEVRREVVDAGQTFDKGMPDFRFAASVAEFGLILRDSSYRGEASLMGCLDRLRAAIGPAAPDDRREFLGLVERAQQIQAPPLAAPVADPPTPAP
jgi:Ca-activated chloride channel family protein